MVFAGIISFYASGDPMRLKPSNLPIQVRPPTIDIEDSSAWLLKGDTWAPSLADAIDGATQSIMLAAYAIQPGWEGVVSTRANVYRALLQAAERGIDCRALLAEHGRKKSTRWFNVKARRDLEQRGWIVRLVRAPKMLHAKCIIVDNKIMTLGSHNFSVSAARENIDLSVMIEGLEACRPGVEWFNEQWSKGETWRP